MICIGVDCTVQYCVLRTALQFQVKMCGLHRRIDDPLFTPEAGNYLPPVEEITIINPGEPVPDTDTMLARVRAYMKLVADAERDQQMVS
jgi:hypothetical protein